MFEKASLLPVATTIIKTISIITPNMTPNIIVKPIKDKADNETIPLRTLKKIVKPAAR